MTSILPHPDRPIDIRLTWAAGKGDGVEVLRLLEEGANVQFKMGSPLKQACNEGHEDVVRLLLQYGADVQADNNIALHEAVYRGHLSIVKLLADHGADFHAEGPENLLMHTLKRGYPDVTRFLLQQLPELSDFLKTFPDNVVNEIIFQKSQVAHPLMEVVVEFGMAPEPLLETVKKEGRSHLVAWLENVCRVREEKRILEAEVVSQVFSPSPRRI